MVAPHWEITDACGCPLSSPVSCVSSVTVIATCTFGTVMKEKCLFLNLAY